MAFSQRAKYSLIGVVVFLSLFILIWGLNYLKGKDIFTNDIMYNVTYENVNGLTASSPVLMRGYKIGGVQKISLDLEDRGEVNVVVGVTPKMKIPVGSIARIISTDLMGTKAVEIQLSKSDIYHTSGDTLMATTEESLKDQVGLQMLPLKHKAEDLLKELEEAIKTVRLIFNEKTRLDIQRSVGHFTSSTKNIDNITKMVDTIVRNKGGDIEQILADIRSLTGTLKSSNNDIQRILHNFSSTSDSLSKVSFKHTFDLLEGTLATINTTVQKLEQGEGTVGQLMKNDSLYKSLLETTQSLNKLTIEFTENPKKYINFSVFDLGKSDKKRKEKR